MGKKHTYEYVKNYFEEKGWELVSTEYKNTLDVLSVICPKSHQTTKKFGPFHSTEKGRGCFVCSGSEKHTYEYVSKYFEEMGWKLLSNDYKGNKTKMDVLCPFLHKSKKSFNSFQFRTGCLTCSGKEKHTYEYVKKCFEQEGWELVSKKYKNAMSKLMVICPKSHQTTKTFNSFHNSSSGCLVCSGLEKHTYEYVKKCFEEKGWKLVAEVYESNITPMKVICPNLHQTTKTFCHFNSEIGCIVCSGNKKHSYEYVKKCFEQEGWELVSKKYKNTISKLVVVCPNLHQTTKTFNEFKNGGTGCITCSGNEKYTHDYVRNCFEERGWELVSEAYKSSHDNLNVICPNLHKTIKPFHSFYNLGTGCNECIFYKNEDECKTIIESITSTQFQKTRPKWLNGLELDGYNEEIEVAFEYNGEQHYRYTPHFHRNGVKDFIYQVCRDKIKKRLCKKQGIDLIVIPYHIEDKFEYISNKFNSLNT